MKKRYVLAALAVMTVLAGCGDNASQQKNTDNTTPVSYTHLLTELCDMLHLPMHVLSKMIKKTTGFNFKELLQRKRLSKAVELMCDTDPVSYTHLDVYKRQV